MQIIGALRRIKVAGNAQYQHRRGKAGDLGGGLRAGAKAVLLAAAVEEVAKSADPVGKTLSGQRLPNGLQLEKVTVPLGVIGIIYEARPNVTSDAAALCLKAGNAVILRGGKEAFRSNQAVVKVLREALAEGGLPADCVQLVEDTSRQSAQELMALTDLIGQGHGSTSQANFSLAQELRNYKPVKKSKLRLLPRSVLELLPKLEELDFLNPD